MRTASSLLARVTLGASLTLAATASIAAAQVIPVGGTFDTPDGLGTLQSGSTDLGFSDDWFVLSSTFNIQQAPVAPSYYPVMIALEGVRPDSILTSPMTMASVDGAQQTLNGATSTGGLRLDRPSLNGLSTFGNLTVSNLYADLATGLVYGSVDGANGVGTKSGVALWQASSLAGESSVFGQPNADTTQILRVTLQDLILTNEGVNIFDTALGMGKVGMGPLTSTVFGSLSVNTVFTMPAGHTMTTPDAVPEPGTWALMGVGLVGLFGAARRRA